MNCNGVSTIHIVGLGAIGTLLGVAFTKAGLSVHTYSGGNSSVRRLTRRHNNQNDTVLVTNHRARIPQLQENEAVLVSVKWPHLKAALSSLSPFLHHTSVLLPQNGIMDEEVLGLCSRQVEIIPVIVRASAKNLKRGTVVSYGNAEF